jgi:hypothetical protein
VCFARGKKAKLLNVQRTKIASKLTMLLRSSLCQLSKHAVSGQQVTSAFGKNKTMPTKDTYPGKKRFCSTRRGEESVEASLACRFSVQFHCLTANRKIRNEKKKKKKKKKNISPRHCHQGCSCCRQEFDLRGA